MSIESETAMCVECRRKGTKGRSRRMTTCKTCGAYVCRGCWMTHWQRKHEP